MAQKKKAPAKKPVAKKPAAKKSASKAKAGQTFMVTTDAAGNIKKISKK